MSEAISLIPSDDETTALQAAQAQSTSFMGDEGFASVYLAMVAFRRAYAVAYRELQEHLQKQSDLHPMTEDLLIQSAMHTAAQPFDEKELVQGFVETVLPWTLKVLERHSSAAAAEREAALMAAEKERRSLPIPLSFMIDGEDDAPGLSRDRSLTLLGEEPVLLWLVDQWLNELLAQRKGDVLVVARLSVKAPRPGEQHAHYIKLAPNEWAECCNDKKRLAAFGRHLLDQLPRNPDLLICDNLAAAYTAGYVGRPDPAKAGDANKLLFRLCKDLGAGMIGLVPAREGEWECSHPSFEQLRTFSTLRPVLKHEIEPGKWRISIPRCPRQWETSDEFLASYRRTAVQTA